MFFVYSGMLAGGIAVSMTLGTYALLSVSPSIPLLVLAFCGTALIYQLDRGLGWSPEDRYNRPAYWNWTRAHRGYVWGMAVLLAGAGGAMLPLVRPVTIGLGLGLGGLGLLHVIPAMRGGRRLKSFGYLKPLAISGAWALGSVLLPVLEAGRTITVGVIALMAYRFVIVLVNTLVADWRDRVGDARAGLRTWATTMSEAVVFGIAYVALTGIMATGVGAVAAGAAPRVLLVDLLGIILMGVFVRCAKHDATWAPRVAVDAVVAWPLVTFLVGWALGRV